MAKILVVDDNEINRLVIVKMLGRHNHQVQEAVDGVDGLAAAKAAPPDLVFTDLLMPRMDGYELIRQLRANSQTAPIPIIVYSTLYMARGASELAKTYGVAEVLTKPSKPEAILKAVNDALGLSSQAATPRDQASQRLELFLETTQLLGLEREPPRLLSNFCERARKLIGSQAALIGLPNQTQVGFQYFFTSGMEVDQARVQLLPLLQPLLQRVTTEQKVFSLGNAETENGQAGPQANGKHTHSFLAAPLNTPKRLYGWICLVNKLDANAFSQEDERLLSPLASQLAVAYENILLNTELGQKVEQYSAQLEAAQREREAFSIFVAQDVRTPLHQIAGYARTLLEKPSANQETEGKRVVKQIFDNASQTEKLISDMLLLSHLGRKEPEKTPIDLSALAQAVVEELQQYEPDRAFNITIQPFSPISADAFMLRHALSCVFANAFKFTRVRSKPAIEFGLRQIDNAPVYYVRDNGAGFDGQQANKVFELFFRAHAPEEFEGRGVGLAIARRAIERQGGRIWAESQPDFGATFFFTLP